MNATQARINALQAIEYEREQQVKQWGDDDERSSSTFALILTKHLGRLAGDILEDGEGDEHYDRADLYRRVIVVGALALAFAEWLNRALDQAPVEPTPADEEK